MPEGWCRIRAGHAHVPDTVEHHHPQQPVIGSAVVNGVTGGGSGDAATDRMPGQDEVLRQRALIAGCVRARVQPGRSSRNMSAIVLLMPIPHPALVADHWERRDGGRDDNAIGSLQAGGPASRTDFGRPAIRAVPDHAVGLHRSVGLGGQVPVRRHGISGSARDGEIRATDFDPATRWSSSARRTQRFLRARPVGRVAHGDLFDRTGA